MSDEGIDRDALMRVFMAEAEENVAAMEQSLLALESAPDDGAVINTIFRAAHTLKGNCASVGLDSLVSLAHAAEDLLHELRDRRFAVTPDLITLLLRAADALKTLLPRAVASPDAQPAPDESLIAALRKAAESGDVEIAPVPAPKPAATAGAATTTATAAAPLAATVRVDVRKLDLLLNAVNELNITRGHARALCQTMGGEVEEMLDHFDQLTDRIQDLALQTRMVPIGSVLRQQIRTVRDLANRVGKEAVVEISGEDVELDTSVIERLRDPLTHMVRNAVDHGIEAPEVREKRGKSRRATISLRASHREGMMVLEVADDGDGIQPDRLRERAKTMNIDTSVMSDRDVLRLILLPGFSTATAVTEVSGRGIGLDVVDKNISAVGGSIVIDSEAGKGTKFTIRLPLTVAVLHGLSTRVGEELFIIPLPTVSECLDMTGEAAQQRAGVFNLRGETLPFLRLRHDFETAADAGSNEKLVVVEYDGKRAALVVDDLIGEARAVVKPMSRLFRRSPWISGSALLGSGEIGLVLEVASILEDVAKRGQTGESAVKEMP